MEMMTMMVMRSHDYHDVGELQIQALLGSRTGAVALGAITDAAAKVHSQERVMQSALFSASG